MNSKTRSDIAQNARRLADVAAGASYDIDLLEARYRWPCAIMHELIRAPQDYAPDYALRASELIDSIARRRQWEPIGAPYFRDLVSALREGGAPIASKPWQGYWWNP